MYSKIIHILFVVSIVLSPASVRAARGDHFEPLQDTVLDGEPVKGGI